MNQTDTPRTDAERIADYHARLSAAFTRIYNLERELADAKAECEGQTLLAYERGEQLVGITGQRDWLLQRSEKQAATIADLIVAFDAVLLNFSHDKFPAARALLARVRS